MERLRNILISSSVAVVVVAGCVYSCAEMVRVSTDKQDLRIEKTDSLPYNPAINNNGGGVAFADAPRFGGPPTALVDARNSALIALSSNDSKGFDKAISKYRQDLLASSRSLTHAQRAEARFELGLLYVQANKPVDAASVFDEVKWWSLRPAIRSSCRYEAGIAYEMIEKQEQAQTLFLTALSDNESPPFAPAAEGLIRILDESDPTKSLEILERTTFSLLERDHSIPAGQIINYVLEKHSSHASILPFVSALLWYMESSGQTLQDMWDNLRNIQSIEDDDSRLAEAALQIESFLNTNVVSPKDIQNGQWRQLTWRNDPIDHEIASRFLVTVGDLLRTSNSDSDGIQNQKNTAAAARYMAAWRFDPDNVVAALQTVASLRAIEAGGVTKNDAFGWIEEQLQGLKELGSEERETHQHGLVYFTLGRSYRQLTHNRERAIELLRDSKRVYDRLGEIRPGVEVELAEALIVFGNRSEAARAYATAIRYLVPLSNTEELIKIYARMKVLNLEHELDDATRSLLEDISDLDDD